MAELATIARPYAEALFKAGGGTTEAEQLNVLAAVAADAQLRQFADNPKVSGSQVFDVMGAVAKTTLAPKVDAFLRTVARVDYDFIDCGAGKDVARVDRRDRVRHCEQIQGRIRPAP